MVDRRSHKRGAGAAATTHDSACAAAATADGGESRRSRRSHAGSAEADSAEEELHAHVELRPFKRARTSGDDHKQAQRPTEETAGPSAAEGEAGGEADVAFKEESKEAAPSVHEASEAVAAAAAAPAAAATAATAAPPAAAPAVLSSPTRVAPKPAARLASLSRPAFGASSPSSAVAAASAQRTLRVRDTGRTVAVMDLTSPPRPGLISMPPSPSAAVSASAGRRLRNARGAESEMDEPPRGNTRSLRTRNSHADGDRAEVLEARPAAAAAASARASSSRSRGSRSTATPPLVQQNKTARQKRVRMLSRTSCVVDSALPKRTAHRTALRRSLIPLAFL